MLRTLEKWIGKKRSTAFLLVLLLAAFNLFFNLGSDPVKDWDEARHGITSAEMLHSGNLIKTTYLGETDYWNLKPPLGIWCITASFSIFGVNPFALRFPSALSAWLCVLLVMLIASKKYSPFVGVLSGLALSLTFPFIMVHSGRTGDFDAMMTFFVVLELFLLYLQLDKKNKIFFFLAALTVPLAFLLKSFAAFIPGGILVLYLVFYWEKTGLHWRDILLTGLVMAVPVGLWVIARYFQDGFTFLGQMAGYDLLKRSTTALEGHSASNLYYLEPFLLYGFPWTWLFLFFLFKKTRILRDKKNKIAGLKFSPYFHDALAWIWPAVPLAVVLIVRTKTAWYLDPLYPAIAVFTAWHIHDLLALIKKEKWVRNTLVGFAALSVVTEAIILAFTIHPALSLSLNKGGNMAELEKEIRFQKIILSIATARDPAGKPGEYSIKSVPEDWTQSRLFLARSMKGLLPTTLIGTNKAFRSDGTYTIVQDQNTADIVGFGKLVSSNASWYLYFKPERR